MNWFSAAFVHNSPQLQITVFEKCSHTTVETKSPGHDKTVSNQINCPIKCCFRKSTLKPQLIEFVIIQAWNINWHRIRISMVVLWFILGLQLCLLQVGINPPVSILRMGCVVRNKTVDYLILDWIQSNWIKCIFSVGLKFISKKFITRCIEFNFDRKGRICIYISW